MSWCIHIEKKKKKKKCINEIFAVLIIVVLKIELTKFLPMFLNDINFDNILVSVKISYGENNYGFFVGYVDENKIKLFSIILPKTSTYVKS